MTDSKIYSSDYFERGIESGLSLYSNYSWKPEMTMSLVMSYIDYLGINRDHKICDFGCAKGFVVKAFRILYRQAWGCDVSEYAVNSSDNETRKYLSIIKSQEPVMPFDFLFNFIIAKDVFEHIPEDELRGVLEQIRIKTEKLFVIVPLGKDGRYIIPAYDLDKTHIIKQDWNWWSKFFQLNGFTITNSALYVPGIKESWSNFPDGNAYFVLTPR